MKPLNNYPERWNTHITKTGELYISRKFRPAEAVILSDRVYILCNKATQGTSKSKSYIGLGTEIGRQFVAAEKSSAKVTLVRYYSTGYILPLPKQP